MMQQSSAGNGCLSFRPEGGAFSCFSVFLPSLQATLFHDILCIYQSFIIACGGGAENARVENERVECVSWRGHKVKG